MPGGELVKVTREVDSCSTVDNGFLLFIYFDRLWDTWLRYCDLGASFLFGISRQRSSHIFEVYQDHSLIK